MATFKEVIFIRDKKKDGTINVKIRITHNRQTRYLPTPFFVTTEQITRTGKLKDRFVLDKVESRIKMLQDKSIQIGFAGNNLDVDQYIRLLEKMTDDADFIKFTKDRIARIRMVPDRKNSANRYTTALNALIDYNGSEKLPFSAMTKSYVRGFYSYLLDERKISVRSANSYIDHLASFYNIAKKELNDEEADIVVVKYSCFQGLERLKEEDTESNAFDTVEEMQRVIDQPYTGYRSYDFAKDMFIFCFVCNGMNMMDISHLRHEQIEDDTITFKRHKVFLRVGNKAELKIKINPIAKAIIEKYSGDPEYVIKYNRTGREAEPNKRIHKIFKLAGVEDKNSKRGERYTFNSARHSMATFLINVCRIDKSVVHQMLVHSNYDNMHMTDVYVKRDYTQLWEANDKLIALFDWSNYLREIKEVPVSRGRGQCSLRKEKKQDK